MAVWHAARNGLNAGSVKARRSAVITPPNTFFNTPQSYDKRFHPHGQEVPRYPFRAYTYVLDRWFDNIALDLAAQCGSEASATSSSAASGGGGFPYLTTSSSDARISLDHANNVFYLDQDLKCPPEDGH